MQGPSTFKVYVQPTNAENLRFRDQRKQALSVLAVVSLGLNFIDFLIPNASFDKFEQAYVQRCTNNVSDDSILNFVHNQRVELALFGEGQEKDLAHDMKTAFTTFVKSKNETVQEQINAFNPKEEELKVEQYETEVKQLFDEVGLEGKMLAKWTKPDK